MRSTFVLTDAGWFAMESSANIHTSLRINSTDSGETLTFHLVPSPGQNFNLFNTSIHDHILMTHQAQSYFVLSNN